MVRKIGKGILAGFIATIAMAVLTEYLAPMTGLPKLDVALSMSRSRNVSKLAGMLLYFMNRMVFLPLIYVLGIRKILPGSGFVKGFIFGVGLWAFIRFLIVPLRTGSIFVLNNPEQLEYALVSLIGNIIYGVIIDKISR